VPRVRRERVRDGIEDDERRGVLEFFRDSGLPVVHRLRVYALREGERALELLALRVPHRERL
jgi:hypothetical protein